MPETGFEPVVLTQQQFALRVPALAQRSLMSVRGCLDAMAAQITVTAVLSTPDGTYLITPAFAAVVTDATVADEYGSALYQPISVDQVAAALNNGFTTLWTPIPVAGGGAAIVDHAADRAAAAAAALTHALRAHNGDLPPSVLAATARIVAEAAEPVAAVAQQASDDTRDRDASAEQTATLVATTLGLAAALLERLAARTPR